MEPQNSLSGTARDIVQAGHIAGGVHFHHAGSQATSDSPQTAAVEPWPRRVGLVPLRADSYQQREVDSLFFAEPAASVQVLVGMGGVGKSQLAAVYAERRWTENRLDLLVWITADSRMATSPVWQQPQRKSATRQETRMLSTRPPDGFCNG